MPRAASRADRVVTVLHKAGTEGVTIGEIATAADVPPYLVKQILHRRMAKRPPLAIVLAARRSLDTSSNRLEEVWGCRCRLNHNRDDAPGVMPAFVTLDEDTIDRGRAGVAAAREALDEARARHRAS